MTRLAKLLLIPALILCTVLVLQFYIITTREIVRCDGGGYA